MVTKQWSRRS